MDKLSFDREWLFHMAGAAGSWWLKPEKTTVDLPHDFSISQPRSPDTFSGASNGFFPGGSAVYEKLLTVPEEWRGRRVFIEFEGIYMNAVVHVNNQFIVRHPYGYTGFYCELTPWLAYGRENRISVSVNNSALPNTRWYSGSGIYRHVWLVSGGSLHIPIWGVFAATSAVSPEASEVTVRTTVENNGSSCELVHVRSVLMGKDGKKVSVCESELEVPAGGAADALHALEVPAARLWSLEDPYLYTLRSEIIKDGRLIDNTETKTGIRTISFDAEKGFCLNGVPTKLKGGCVHHDCGLLGAASYDRAEERKVELLKASGYNAARCAHNPPSPAFLDACDRLGMLVMDEAFDCWREGKNPNDYSVYFEEWWQRDLKAMIFRDRNHPSVIMWSTGNELPERDGRSDGYEYARRLAGFVRSLDATRAVTNALCGITPNPLITGLAANVYASADDRDYWGELSSDFVSCLDVVGYNYLLERYEDDGKKFPGRIICGTESFPKQAFENWEAINRLPYVIGDFVWTGIDYLGESGLGHVWYDGEEGFLGGYPWHQAYCGDIDICGFKRPQSYYRDNVWGISKTPYIAVHKPGYFGKKPDISAWGWPDVIASWTWPGYEGKPVAIDVYSTDDEIELILNGSSLGRKPAGAGNRFTASFETVYEAGELVAVGYKNGAATTRAALSTAGNPAAIRLTPDRSILRAEFGDLSYVTAEIIDNSGNIVHNADNSLFFTVCGAGSLLAVGNGNPKSGETYTGNQRRAFEGRAMAVVRTGGIAGEIVLTAAAEGIKTAYAILKAE